jgi:hypothetical protein
MKKIFPILVFVVVLFSCNNYYKAITVTNPVKVATVEELQFKNKYFILRAGEQAFSMTDFSLTSDKKTIQCKLGKLPFNHRLYITQGGSKKMKYGKENAKMDETFVLDEVHFYVAPDPAIIIGPTSISFDKLQKIAIIEKDKQKTQRSHMMGIIAAIVASALALTIIFGLAISSSMAAFHF